MKKVLIMLTSMNIGGVEKSLLSLLSQLPKEIFKVKVLLLEKCGGLLEFIPKWVEVEEAEWFKDIKPIIMEPPKKTVENYISNRKYSEMVFFTLNYIISKKFDDRFLYYRSVLHSIPKDHEEYDVAISYQSPTDIIDFYIAYKVSAKKKISWIHFDITKHKINIKLYKKLHARYDKIFVVSKQAKERFLEVLPHNNNKTEVFYNIISSELINELTNETIMLDPGYSGTKIVTVGRLSKEKGQEIAIKALSKLVKAGYNARWYCIGEGNERLVYEKIIKDYGLQEHFFLLGAKPNPYPYIKYADIYVQTSIHEGYCLTLAEAKCLHKPIITTNFTGAEEQIENQVNGIIINYSANELFMSIKELIDSNSKQRNFIKNLMLTKADTSSEITKLLEVFN